MCVPVHVRALPLSLCRVLGGESGENQEIKKGGTTFSPAFYPTCPELKDRRQVGTLTQPRPSGESLPKGLLTFQDCKSGPHCLWSQREFLRVTLPEDCACLRCQMEWFISICKNHLNKNVKFSAEWVLCIPLELASRIPF